MIGLNDMRSLGGWVGAVGAIAAIFVAWLLHRPNIFEPSGWKTVE